MTQACALASVDWQACATLATGVMAVGAALLVGGKQAKILEGQNRLKENELRISLLKFRADAIVKAQAFLWSHRDGMAPLSFEDMQLLYEEIERMRLVFPESVAVQFEGCMSLAHRAYELFYLAQIPDGADPDQESINATSVAFAFVQREVLPAFEALLKQMISHARVDFA